MDGFRCGCVFPAASEEELGTLPGTEPNTAVRIYLQAGTEGYVRIQHLAYDAGLGWYVQKSMVLPGCVLKDLATLLRKADCLIPKAGLDHGCGTTTCMRLVPADAPLGDDTSTRAERKRA